MSPRLKKAIEIATKAGQATLEHFNKNVEVEYKQDDSPVTIADKKAEHIVRKELALEFPGEAVLGEEEGLTGSGSDRWVVDPIDGTKSFVSGVPLYSTLLSYEVNKKPVLGVVYFPALNEIIYAELGHGAYWNGVQCHVSKKSDLAKSVLCCAGHSGMNRAGLSEGMNELAQECMATRTWCDAYGHILVATGRVEAMIDPYVSRWDISALIPILTEAEGVATRIDGQDVLETVNEDGVYQLVSCNQEIFPAIQNALKS